MKHPKSIEIKLLSNTTFGGGHGTAGGVNACANYDSLGLPIVSGKTIHGLLKDSWLKVADKFPELNENANRILGYEAVLSETAILRVGDARLPDEVREWVEYALHRRNHPLTKQEILNSLTTVRTQTAVSRESGSYEEETLRTTQAVLRGVKMISPLDWLRKPTEQDLRVLAMTLLLTRHGGLARTRGSGHIKMTFDGDYERTLELAEGGQ